MTMKDKEIPWSYTVIVGSSVDDFSEEVEGLIRFGYTPHGSLQIFNDACSGQTFYAQALVEYRSKKELEKEFEEEAQ